MKVFQIQNTLYQIQTLLNKYKIYFLPTTEHLYVAPNNRIAKTYQNHNTRPHTKYKQHTPDKLQNECIATIHQIQNHGKNNKRIILHTKYRKNSFYYTKYRTLQHQGPMPNTGHSMQHDTDRTLQHPNMSISVQESAPHSCSCLLIQCCTLIMCQWYEWNAITGLHCI